ncbi:MAG TPA: GAF domain-containing protein, partial [Gemmatimonadales bacterium]|nr:GAF domain-containing protein [Gemmatimonadales bacterium]
MLQAGYMPPEAESPLIPLLSPDEAVGDPIALATWYEALSSALSVELNHDLLGLWLYPASGGVHLIGPEALAQDQIDVPLPEPYVPQDQLFRLEEKVRSAGYGSVMAVPIRFGYQDVGLMLLADLRPARYTANEAVLLQRVAHHLGPTFGRVARQWVGEGAATETDYRAALADGAAPLLASGGPPRDFARAMFDLLMPLLPHDRGEILIPGSAADQWYRLSEHTSGALWNDPALIIPNEDLNVDALFGESDHLLVGDTRRDPRWAGWPGGLRDFRSAAGVRLRVAGRRVGFMVVGGSGPDLFRDHDIE